jgi:hypothetical protein
MWVISDRPNAQLRMWMSPSAVGFVFDFMRRKPLTAGVALVLSFDWTWGYVPR